jgi:hypothetical protein
MQAAFVSDVLYKAPAAVCEIMLAAKKVGQVVVYNPQVHRRVFDRLPFIVVPRYLLEHIVQRVVYGMLQRPEFPDYIRLYAAEYEMFPADIARVVFIHVAMDLPRNQHMRSDFQFLTSQQQPEISVFPPPQI